jgi:hypothetical protein
MAFLARRKPCPPKSRFESSALRTQEGGFLLAGAGSEAGLFPEFFPLPDVGSFVEDAVAELAGEHENLAAMVGFVGEHVGEHGAAGGPSGHPTVAEEFRDAAMRSGGESIRQHAEALRGAFLVRGGSLLLGAAVGIERRGALQMRRGAFQPLSAAVVEMREDGRDGAAAGFFSRRLGAPGTRVELREDELVHSVVARVGFEQGVANLGQRGVRWERHGSSAHLLNSSPVWLPHVSSTSTEV